MEKVTDLNGFYSLLKYAVSITLFPADETNGLPTIGIIFGNSEIPYRCHEYFVHSISRDSMKIEIATGIVTAKIELNKTNRPEIIFPVELNFDQNELLEFQDKTSAESKVMLLFGFRDGAMPHFVGVTDGKAEYPIPVLLAGFSIISNNTVSIPGK